MLAFKELAVYSAAGRHVTILDAGRATLEINDPAYAAYVDEVEAVHASTFGCLTKMGVDV